jgi:hypothetical protein
MFSSAVVRGQQAEVLEHEADLPVPQLGALVPVHARDVAALEEVLAARRPVEQAEDVHERRLARARGADDRDHRALRDLEAHAAQRVHRHVPSAYERFRSTMRMSDSATSPQRWRRWNCGLKGLLEGELPGAGPRGASRARDLGARDD